jgi:hypothetical protein
VVITLVANPTTANAGPDQTVCGTGATLAANAASVGTGAWSIVSGAGGSFGNSASNTSSFTGVAGTTYTLRWTISNAPCTASTDDVVITLVAAAPVADAGTDQSICSTPGTATMAANAASPGTGTWSQISGGAATITTPNSPTTTITGMTTNGARVFRWTIANAPCPSTFDDVTISVSSSALWYQDEDGDGLGNPAVALSSCTQPNGYVSNSNDLCLNTPLGEGVNSDGCSCSQVTVDDGDPCTLDQCANGTVTHTFQDADADGVCNVNDQCPGTASGAGVNAQGCSCAQVTVDDGDPCTLDQCTNGTVTHTFQDADGDAVCDANDLCPGTASGAGVNTQGCSCAQVTVDDGDPCTLDQCTNGTVTHTFQDADGDAVCDASDSCPGTASGAGVNAQGCSCAQVTVDDGNPCTLDECLNGVVTHTFQDADGDGTCDANDQCPGGPEPGTLCDDGNGATTGDVIQANCLCAGVLGCTPGTPCNDFNACTTGEVYDANCNCGGGTPVDPNDNNPCTLDSCDPVNGVSNVFQDADNDGVCDASDLCPGSIVSAGIGVNVDGCTCAQVTVDDGNPCTLDECLNGVVTHTFQDADGDGTCDANDQCPGGPEPGTLCDDGNGATTGDVIQANCLCAGVLGCTPGTPCNDFNACTTGEVYDANCNCGGGTPVDPNDNNPCTLDSCDPVNGVSNVFQDADNDGVCDASDLCPGSIVSAGIGVNADGCTCAQVSVDDGDPCTLDECLNGVVTHTLQDADNDGICDADDDCPTVEGEIGSSCDDGNSGTTDDEINANCECEGTPVTGCEYPVNMVINTDANGAETSWEILIQGSSSVVCSGGPYTGANNSVVTESCCLTNACYVLRVFDSGGDGITGGGYLLSRQDGTRIIDNRQNGGFTGLSAIANGEGFCLPTGPGRLIATSCDKEWWTGVNQYVVADDDDAVSTVYNTFSAGSPEYASTGYQMWWFDPNGGYTFRRFQSHNTTNGLAASATRACHFKINAWSGNQLQAGVLYNVRVRHRVLGTYNEFGAACRFRIDQNLALCPPTQLVNSQGPEYSCGVVRQFPSTQKLWAWGRPGANRYQFEFAIPSEGILFTRTSTTNWIALNWSGANVLLDGRTYNVRVRISKTAGATWCPWGETCLVTISNGGEMVEGTSSSASDMVLDTRMTVWPNPNRGEALSFRIDGLGATDDAVSIELFDLLGNRVITTTRAAQDGVVNGSLDLPADLGTGMYVMHVSSGDRAWTERVVLQR